MSTLPSEQVAQLAQIKKHANKAITDLKAAINYLKEISLIAENTKTSGDISMLNKLDTSTLGLRATNRINSAGTQTQYVVRECSPDLLFSFKYRLVDSLDDEAHSENYQVFVSKSGLYVRVPLVPVSAYRIDAKSKNLDQCTRSKKRYFGLLPMIRQAGKAPISGPKLVHIIHVFHNMPAYKKAPDFDNFDVKDLIDCVMNGYGGDGPRNVESCIHETILSHEIPEGTYIAVRSAANSMTIAELRKQVFEHFCKTENFKNTDS